MLIQKILMIPIVRHALKFFSHVCNYQQSKVSGKRGFSDIGM